jgi:hypothetical protein
MAQTTKSHFIYPDGCKLEVKASGDSTYTELGTVMSTVANTFEFDENQTETANYGLTEKQVNNMKVSGSFELASWDPTAMAKISGGLLTKTTTAASPISTIPDQTVATGWVDKTVYPLTLLTSSSDSTPLKMTTAPTLTSVTLDAGTPEVLVADTEYFIIPDTNSFSGYSIMFNESAMSTSSPTTYTITIVYGTNTPVATETLSAGASQVVLSSYEFRFTHTDPDTSAAYSLTLFKVDPNSGFFQFNFKGANEDGLSTIPVTYMARSDTSKTSGQQLLQWVQDAAVTS